MRVSETVTSIISIRQVPSIIRSIHPCKVARTGGIRTQIDLHVLDEPVKIDQAIASEQRHDHGVVVPLFRQSGHSHVAVANRLHLLS
jgi:hypothetical protein